MFFDSKYLNMGFALYEHPFVEKGKIIVLENELQIFISRHDFYKVIFMNGVTKEALDQAFARAQQIVYGYIDRRCEILKR
jgi:hypothetical protein